MKKIVRLRESDLIRLVKRVINEQENDFFTKKGYTLGDFSTLKSLVSNFQKKYPDYTKYYYKGNNVKLITNGTQVIFISAPRELMDSIKELTSSDSLGPHPISNIQSKL
jgi:hypothetical protein